MLKKLFLFLMVASICTICFAGTQSVLRKADNALTQIGYLTVEKLISDDLIVYTMSNIPWADWRGLSYAARRGVFNEHQCFIFENEGVDVKKACYKARYHEDSYNPARYSEELEEFNISLDLLPKFREMRKAIFAFGKGYLSVPNNVQTIYNRKKVVALEYFDVMEEEKRQNLLKAINIVLGALVEVRDGTAPAEYDPRHEYGFAYRRLADGGLELVQAYIDVISDFKKQVGDV